MQVIKGDSFITTYAVWAGVVIAAVGAGTAGYSVYAQGEAAEDTAEYNAEVARIKAADALQIGADEAADKRLKTRRLISSQIEGGAMSGVSTDYGTPLGLLTETAGIGEVEALTIVNNAQRQAWGHEAQSELDVLAGQNAKRKSRLDTLGTTLSGASSVYSTGRTSGLWQ